MRYIHMFKLGGGTGSLVSAFSRIHRNSANLSQIHPNPYTPNSATNATRIWTGTLGDNAAVLKGRTDLVKSSISRKRAGELP